MDKRKRIGLKHLILFLVTFCTTTIAGAEWMFGKFLYQTSPSLTWQEVLEALHFSIPFLLILTCHEFGHYFTARHYNIRVTLPFYIPLWLGFLPLPLPSIGTMGALIRIKERIRSRTQYFDVGIAGPLAGFVVAMGFIWYGFTHLPEPEYIFRIHPEYEQYGLDYAEHVYEDTEGFSVRFGDNLIYWFFQNYVVEDKSRIPHPYEMIHYPYLLAGYLALFFTALNLLPIGQLDGGHIIFGLFGRIRHATISKVLFTLFLFYAGLGFVTARDMGDLSSGGLLNFLGVLLIYLYFLYICAFSLFERKQDRWTFAAVMLTVQFMVAHFFHLEGYTGWMLFALILGRFVGIYHPPVADNKPLTTTRKILGWIALIIFIISFSPQPLIFEIPGE